MDFPLAGGGAQKVTRKSQSPVADFLKVNAPDSPGTAALREENARLRRKIAVSSGTGDLIVEAVERAYDKPVKFTLGFEPKRKAKGKPREAEAAVCHVSDTQFGKITSTYDTAIAGERIAEYARKVRTIIDRKRSYCDVTEAHIYLGGDMIEGETIFAGQAHLIDEGVLEQAVRSAPLAIASMIVSIATEVERTKVVCVSGNHGRSAPKGVGAHPVTNWDRVCYEVTRLLVLGPDKSKPNGEGRITFDIADDFYAVDDVLGHPNLVLHGHQIRGGFGGFPWYGVGKKAAGWIDAIPQPWTRLYFGHFHTLTSGRINDREWYCNGTTESDNAYAREELAAAGIPMQRLQFFSAEHGVVSDHQVYLTAGLKRARKVRT